jgi:hypothetical protein
MATKNLLRNNRVYLIQPTNNNNTNSVYCNVIQDWSETSDKLYVDNTDNFSENGYITCIDGYSVYYYTSKGINYFNIKLDEKRKKRIGIIFRKGCSIKQECNIINNNYDDINNNNFRDSKYNLSGWYSNGKTNQATLKVSEANVIIPGAIRFIKGDNSDNSDNSDNNNINGRFQGCVSVNSNGHSHWVDFNAIKGDTGNDGNINTTLKYETIGSGNGQLIKTNELDVNTEQSKLENYKVLVRSITADSSIVNGKECHKLKVKTDDENVLIDLDNVGEVVYDLTDEFSDIKGNPVLDKKLNCYGEQIRIRVCKGFKVEKGQIVAISLFEETIDGVVKKYYGVKPLSLDNGNDNIGNELLKYQIGNGNSNSNVNNSMKYCFGLSREYGVDGDIINILVNGVGILRIGNNVEGMNTISTTTSKYIGYPVLLDKKGFGFICQNIAKLPEPHMEIGSVMEIGDIGETGNYILIKFNPVVYEL